MSAKQTDGVVVRILVVVVVACAVMVALMTWAAVAQPFSPDNDAWTVVHTGLVSVADGPAGFAVAAPSMAPASDVGIRLCASAQSLPTGP